ncbi:MAG TPA: HD domain-containing protein [Candidatus Aminicenantes bacterium]|nr:HD domain-containing protein [Candidatus Aminicenantes bacterium]
MNAGPPRDFVPFIRRFNSYIRVFRGTDNYTNTNIDIKAEHTHRVCRHSLDICGSLNLSGKERKEAFLAALFHDVGRFSQIHRYGTFNDRTSVNHAMLGVIEIKANNLLAGILPEECRRILSAVMLHNRHTLPRRLKPAALRLCRVLRDADKMDILDVLINYYTSRKNGSNPALDLELPVGSTLSDAALADIDAGRSVAIENVQSIQDFRLLQAAWVFDIHSAWAMQRLRNLGQIDWLLQQLPPGRGAKRATRRIHDYMKNFTPTLLPRPAGM